MLAMLRMNAESLGAWALRHRAQLRLSLRITVACLLTFALGHLLHLAQSYWAVLTAIIVTQASVGGSLKATIDRFIGSLGGAVWGVAVSLVIPHGTTLMLGVAMTAGLAPLAVVAAFYPQYRIAPVTAIILLLTPNNQLAGPLAAAVSRMLEVGLGSVVAVAVALTILPERAHGVLSGAAGRALALMGDLISVLMAGLVQPRDPRAIEALHDRIRAAIRQVEAAADETVRERRIYLTDAPDPDPLCRTLRRLQHDLVMIGRASITPLSEPVSDRLLPSAATLAEAITGFFRETGAAVAAQAPPPSMDGVEKALADYAAAGAQLRSSGLTRDLPDEALGRIFSLAFALEQLHQNLKDLVDRAGERANPARP
jgi:uncharacterized membrane protein YccC